MSENTPLLDDLKIQGFVTSLDPDLQAALKRDMPTQAINTKPMVLAG
jgi:hypothetical protein